MISVSDPPSCTRTRKYARDDIPITVGTSERKSTSSGGRCCDSRGYSGTRATVRGCRSQVKWAAHDRVTGKERGSSRRSVIFWRFHLEKHNPCYPVSLTSSAWERAVAKPSENTSRDETAALAGRVAMRRKTPQRQLVADVRVRRRYRSAPPGPGQHAPGESSLVAHQEG
jgi:hypothetical protein